MNYIILSNRANERIKFFKSFIKKNSTYIFEKPIATDALENSQKKNFLEIIKKNKIKIKAGYCLRLNPTIKKLKQIIKNQSVISIKMNIRPISILERWTYTKSVSQIKNLAGIINELSHELDLMLFVCKQKLFLEYLNSKSLKVDVEDIDIIFKFNNRPNLKYE